MNPEERSLLERTYRMSQENHEILLSLQRSNRIGIAFKIFYWVILIGLSVGSIYFIQPYVNFLMDTFDGNGVNVSGEVSPTQDYVENLRDLLK